MVDADLVVFLVSLRDGLAARRSATRRVREALPRGDCWWHVDPETPDDGIWDELSSAGENVTLLLFDMLQRRVTQYSVHLVQNAEARAAAVQAGAATLAEHCAPSLRRILCREAGIAESIAESGRDAE